MSDRKHSKQRSDWVQKRFNNAEITVKMPHASYRRWYYRGILLECFWEIALKKIVLKKIVLKKMVLKKIVLKA